MASCLKPKSLAIHLKKCDHEAQKGLIIVFDTLKKNKQCVCAVG